MIVTIRHPVDAYASLRRRLDRDSGRGKPEGRLRWLRISPRGFAGRWRRVVRDERRAMERWPGRVLQVRYEDLTDAPVETLRRVCAFIDEPFDAVVAGDREAERDSHGAPTKQSQITRNLSVWRDWIDESEAALLERKLAREMRRLDYEPIAERDTDAARVSMASVG